MIVVLSLCLCHCGADKTDVGDLHLVGKKSKAKSADTWAPVEDKPGKAVAEEGIVVDLIVDLVFRNSRDGWTLNTPDAHVNVAKLRKGGVDLVFSALPVAPGKRDWTALEQAFEVTEKLVADTNGNVEIASTFNGAVEGRKKGAVQVLFLLEGADALVGKLDRLGELKRRGLAAVGLVAGRSNAFADVAVAPREETGLTREGALLLEACRDLDIAVDLTHGSNAAFWDALSEQAGMIMVSHTAAHTIREHPRNLDDIQILALSRYGGLMGLVFNPDFLKAGVSSSADMGDAVAHILHVKSLGAINALALGTDYGGIVPPKGLEDISTLPDLRTALARQGISDEEIGQIMGGNASRFFEEIERKRGAMKLTKDDIERPVAIDCESVLGEFEGAPPMACNGRLMDQGPLLPPSSRQKVRIKQMRRRPERVELFGEPGTPWQVEGQSLDGKVLLNRIVALDDNGQGVMPLPSGRNLARIFLSPTRSASLREIVVWGH